MNWYPLLALVAFAYAALVIYLAQTKKPEAIWNMAKIQAFVKVLGERGTVIFFYVWGAIFAGLGIWLITL
jgi:UDP-N-acetylmuramyl pentapeptide phosphotransferase/UDP-N-acetylglucosamine-1-phosphate transferase